MNKKQNKIYNWLLEHPGYLKKSVKDISYAYTKTNLKLNEILLFSDVEIALKQARITYKACKLINEVSDSSNNKVSLKRLYFDIETSPNIVYSWNIGYNLNIDYNNIIKERAIICICWKWEGESEVNYLSWNNGDDKEMIHKFYNIILQADEVIGHNSDKFDIKWFNARCLYHGILNMPEICSIDTLKLSRKHFKFNSNRLDYIGQFLNLGKKIDTGGFSLWKEILDGNEKSLFKMITYCQNDVILLEKVFNKLNGYSKPKTNISVLNNLNKCNCPKCSSSNIKLHKTRYNASGMIKRQMQCDNCGTYYTISNLSYNKLILNK